MGGGGRLVEKFEDGRESGEAWWEGRTVSGRLG